MKLLYFEARGKWFVVNEKGEITQDKRNEQPKFSGNWKFLGVSYHHWRRGIDTHFEDCFQKPDLMLKGYVWDKDHGTTRQWLGSSSPRVTRAYTKEVDYDNA
mgnify:CR=1 FL=1